MNVAILGYGVVGKSVYQIIKTHFPDIKIKYVLVKSMTEGDIPEITTDFQKIINDSTVDVVLEMINGDNPAYHFITSALKSGKHVISSNKLTIASHLAEYVSLAQANQVQIKFEASVGGGIYWIQSLLRAIRIDQISEITGIMNGTSNYILDNIKKQQAEFEVVLQKAIELGYAEKDYSADIDGYDVLSLEQPFVMGIRNITLDIIQYLDLKGFNVKLIGSSYRKDNQYYMSVEPYAINKNLPLATVNDNNNLISLKGTTIGQLDFIGQGAGGNPTANAMVSDLLDISEKRYDNLLFNQKMIFNDELQLFEYYIFTTALNEFQEVAASIEQNVVLTKPITEKQKNLLIKNSTDSKLFCAKIRWK